MPHDPAPDTRASAAWGRCWPPALLLALLLAYFGPALASGVMLAPHDGIALNYPVRLLWAEALRHGEWPFWNPFQFGGQPFLATVHPGLFFPPNWLFLILPALWAWNAIVITAYWGAGVGAYAFGRAIGLFRPAALAVAVTFMLSGFLIAHLEQIMMVQAAAFLPALLWAVERLRLTGRARYAMAGCVLLALQVLVGFPMVVALSLLVVGPYALFRGLGLPRGERSKFFLALAGALGLALGLCLVQLLPAMAFIPLTQRGHIPYEYLTWHSLHPRQLLLYWVPYLVGGPVSWLSPTRFWGIGPYLVEIAGYAGLGALALATVAAIGRFKDSQTRFWLAIAAVALLLSFGRYTPLYQLVAHLPVIKTMPGPGRHALEVDMALAVLAGLGLQALATAAPGVRRRLAGWGLAVAAGPVLLTAVGVALLAPRVIARMQPLMPPDIALSRALTLANPGLWVPIALAAVLAVALFAVVRRPGPLSQAALLAVMVGDLAVFGHHVGWRQLSPTPGDALVTRAPAMPTSEERLLSVAASRYPYDNFQRAQTLRYGLLAAMHGDRAIGGYDSFYYARYGRLLGFKDSSGLLTDPRVWDPAHQAFDILALRTLRLEASLVDSPIWRQRLAGDRWRPAGEAPGVAIFTNTRHLPRAWRPPTAVVLGEADVDARVRGEQPWEARREALVEGASPGPLSGGPVTARTLGLNRIALETDGPGPGLVVVSEGYDPGWSAFSGDRELRVRRVNALLIGVEVPAGRHTVTLSYEPPLWRAGLAGSALSLLLLGGWAAWRVRRARRSGLKQAAP